MRYIIFIYPGNKIHCEACPRHSEYCSLGDMSQSSPIRIKDSFILYIDKFLSIWTSITSWMGLNLQKQSWSIILGEIVNGSKSFVDVFEQNISMFLWYCTQQHFVLFDILNFLYDSIFSINKVFTYNVLKFPYDVWK